MSCGDGKVSDLFTFNNTPPSLTTQLVVRDVTTTTARLTWDEASDSITPASELEYRVVYSTDSTLIDTAEKVAALAGNGVLLDWSKNQYSRNVTGLTQGTTYYFSLIIRNSAGLYSLSGPIQTSTIAANNLVLYLDAGNPDSYSGSGNTWFDLSGNNLNANLVNDPDYTTDNQGALIFSSVNNDPTNPYGEIPYNALLQPANQVSIAMWLWADPWRSPVDYQSAISNTQGGGYAMFLINDYTFRAMARANGSYRNADLDSSDLSGWHHLVYTYDNRYVRIYLDGQLLDTTDTGGVNNLEYSQNNSLLIGAEASAGNTPEANPKSWVGKIGMVQIYSRALTDQEVRGNYNAHKLRYDHTD